jgi:hypothetical protein
MYIHYGIFFFFLQMNYVIFGCICAILVIDSNGAQNTQCQSNTLTLPQNDVSHTSLCPWIVTNTCDRHRLPRRMNNVTCLPPRVCPSCSPARIQCRPVIQAMPVRRIGNSSWVWSTEMINVACIPVLDC